MKPLHLRGRKNCDYINRKGQLWKGKTMNVRYIAGMPKNIDKPREGLYLGTFAGTKLHKSAVKRNYMRRRCREAIRIHLQDVEKYPTVQLLVSPRSPSLTCDYSAVKADAEYFLQHLPSWLTKSPSTSRNSS